MKRINHIFPVILLIILIRTQAMPAAVRNLAREVNPMIGTDFTGNTYPGAQVPHGLVQLSPDNGLPGWDRIAGYFYPDSTIAGFSHTHLSGTGAGDLYDISFLPVCGTLHIAPGPLGIHSRFSHDNESAHAGFYSVRLLDYGIDVELTATEHCGLQRYTWPSDEGSVILDLAKAMNWDKTVETALEIVDSVTVRGYRHSDGWARNQKVWFETRFSQPFTDMRKDTTGGITATFRFKTSPGGKLVVATAISGTDAAGATANLDAEAPHNDFDRYVAEAENKWNRILGKIEIDCEDNDQRSIFYTAIYHSLLAPVIFSDADGRYRGPDGKIHHTLQGRKHYSTFSLWDTFRAAHPLYTIIEPDAAADMVCSIIDFSSQNGRLPVWNMWASETDMMIGYHAAAVIADAAGKSLPGIDLKKALEECVRTARNDSYRSIGDYRRLGFVACDLDSSWSMSKTLEYAFDDWAIARLADLAGDNCLKEEFLKRAKNYHNQFNHQTGFMQPRRSDGSFTKDFNPEDYTEDICESNAWQYLWSVQHDIEGLVSLTGGRKAFEKLLDRFFSTEADTTRLPIFSTGMIGQYAHGNEPGHHAAYLYNHTDSPEKGHRILRRIMSELYDNTPSGLCGNEDCGQMSAWYVFSALGFYPVNPASGEYETGITIFDRARIHLDNGNTVTITRNPAIPVSPTSISHKELLDGIHINLH